MIEWHKILGMTLVDFFSNTNYSVEIEKELELPQFLDYLVVKGDNINHSSLILPDGMETLSQYNLLTFKSLRQPLDLWAVDELISYYVLYRKIISPSPEKLISENNFKLFCISTRFPTKLSKEVSLIPIKKGVFHLNHGHVPIVIIVIAKLPQNQKNAIFHLFSTKSENMSFALKSYHWKREDIKHFVIKEMYEQLQKEEIQMSYTVEDFKREVILKSLHTLSTEERLKGLRPEDRLKGLRPEDRLKGLRPEDRLKGLRPEDRLKGINPEDVLNIYRPEDRLKGLRPEDRLKGLEPEEIELLKNLLMNMTQEK